MGLMERIAPRRLAVEGDRDRVGLAVGSPEDVVERVLVALDPTLEAVAEAAAAGAGLLLTHHPLLFRPLNAVRTDAPVGAVVAAALTRGVALFSAHTNLDVVEGGVSSVLAEALGLGEVEVLAETEGEPLVKLVVFVPATHAEAVRQALGKAGAGHLGRYGHCTFSAPGTGAFLPEEGTQPFLGRAGELERVEEERVETILPERLLPSVVQAMRRVHPYEEVACDVYPLQNQAAPVGLGRVGRLTQELTLAGLVDRVKAALGVDHVEYLGEPERLVSKVAVCGGSAGDLAANAVFRGADVLVAGEVKYHDGLTARQQGLAVIAAGHDATERVIVPALVRRLQEEAGRLRLKVEFRGAQADGTLWRRG
jgi:dinuclear metal center YbgI/SA1388 family protein